MEIGIAMPATNALERVAGAAFGAARVPRDASGSDFASLIRNSLALVDSVERQAETAAARWQPGRGDGSLEDALRSMQKADLGLQATAQVRDKLVAAYNDIMNMPL